MRQGSVIFNYVLNSNIMELSKEEMKLLKEVLQPLYKTAKKEDGLKTYHCHVCGITRKDLKMLISIHDRIVDEELQPDGPDLSGYTKDFQNAIKYVKENLPEDTAVIIRAKVDRNYRQNIIGAYGIDEADEVCTLLGEYAEENDLEENFWEEEADIDEIIMLI